MYRRNAYLVKALRRLAVVAALFLTPFCAVVSPVQAAASFPHMPGGSPYGVDAAPTPPPPELTPPAQEDRQVITGDQVVSGSDYVLRSNETLRGDLTIFGGNVTLQEGSQVQGNITIFGGNADIGGIVTGDLTAIGGNVRLRSTSRVDGKQNTVGGSIERDPGAQVRSPGQDYTRAPFTFVFPQQQREPFTFVFDLIGSFFARLTGAILAVLLAIAVVALFPAQVAQTASVVQSQWLVAGSIGILTTIVMPVVIVVLAITICLLPAAVILGLGWALASLFGWVVAARIVGERLASALNLQSWSAMGRITLGALLLALTGMLPLIGWLVGLLASAVGMGALILTRGGTQPYPKAIDGPPTLPLPASTV